jgi:hypothetical protein
MEHGRVTCARISTRLLLTLRSCPRFAGQEVTSGFSGTFDDNRAEVFSTTLVGNRSLSFHATLKKLADI